MNEGLPVERAGFPHEPALLLLGVPLKKVTSIRPENGELPGSDPDQTQKNRGVLNTGGGSASPSPGREGALRLAGGLPRNPGEAGRFGEGLTKVSRSGASTRNTLTASTPFPLQNSAPRRGEKR